MAKQHKSQPVQVMDQRVLSPSEKLLIDLVCQAYQSGILPEPEVVSSQIDRFLCMDVSAIVAGITNNRTFVTHLPTFFSIVSTMSDKDVANTLITSLDKYYHDIIDQIYSDEKMTKMFVDVFKGVLSEVRNA